LEGASGGGCVLGEAVRAHHVPRDGGPFVIDARAGSLSSRALAALALALFSTSSFAIVRRRHDNP
jgi:hypothetical protein